MTWDELVAAIGKWAARPEIEQAVATFIALTEADLNRRLSEAGIAGAEGRAHAVLEAGAEYGAAPAGLARAIRMTLGDDGAPVEAVTPDGLAALRSRGGAGRGQPRAFALSGASFRYHPVPDADYAVELTYQNQLEPLSAARSVNWVSQAHPDVYLYGALAQAAGHLADEAMLARWTGPYEQAVAALIAAERGRRGSPRAGAYRPDLPLSPAPGGFHPNRDI